MTTGYLRYARTRNIWLWLGIVALVAILMLTTNLFISTIPLRLPQFRAYDRVRVTPYPEIAAVLLGISGAIMIGPQLGSWEASASRRLWPYKIVTSLIVIAVSAATVLLVPLGRAYGPHTIQPREEWKAEALAYLVPYAISAITLVSIALIMVNYLGSRIGAIAALAFTIIIWIAQITPVGAQIIPIAGPSNPPQQHWSQALQQPHVVPLAVTAIVAAIIAIIIWTRRQPTTVFDETA